MPAKGLFIINIKGENMPKELEFYRNVKMSESTVDKVNEISSQKARSFAGQAKLIFELGLKEYERTNK